MSNIGSARGSSDDLGQPGSIRFFRAPEVPHDEVTRIRELLSLTQELTRSYEAPLRTERLDFHSTDTALRSAREAILQQLSGRKSAMDEETHTRADSAGGSM